MAAEGGEAHVALAAGAEADTWGADHIGTIEQILEELPGAAAVGGAHPDVRGVLATVDLEAQLAQLGEHAVGVVHIVVDGLLNLLLALRGVDGLCGALGDVAGAIELGALTAQPELVEGDALTFEGETLTSLGTTV